MKLGFFGKFDYNFIEGKGLLIAIIISFSSISFIIGFFAGKKFSGGEIPQSAKKIGGFVVTEVKTIKEETAHTVATPTPDITTEQERPAPETTKHQQQQQKIAGLTETPHAIEETYTEPVAEVHEPSPKPQRQVHQTPRQEQKPEPKAAVKKTAQPKVKPVPEKLLKQPEAAHGQRYFIQVGAFKNVLEAEKVQEDLKRKGFSANILKTPIKDGVTLFKVRVGDYSSQTEANAVLGRLSKKGFKAFIRGEPR
ncbi:MAG: SPOR domain-containing protein [Nitrospirae bacterium]|nr:SPOR domain-containing protein [Nitrospirota bacterium]MBF0534959.1 SPOR domain-containing protein [Nitrospirota bacterium]MBF0617190.1 SPOR domain-containing protein [Nitrospirota bacterium]